MTKKIMFPETHYEVPSQQRYFDESTTSIENPSVFDASKVAGDYGVKDPDVFVTFATAVTITPSTKTLAINATQQLTVIVTPDDGDNRVVYSTSDATKATVDQNGLVTAKATGTATITVKSLTSDAKGTCVITIGS